MAYPQKRLGDENMNKKGQVFDQLGAFNLLLN